MPFDAFVFGFQKIRVANCLDSFIFSESGYYRKAVSKFERICVYVEIDVSVIYQ